MRIKVNDKQREEIMKRLMDRDYVKNYVIMTVDNPKKYNSVELDNLLYEKRNDLIIIYKIVIDKAVDDFDGSAGDSLTVALRKDIVDTLELSFEEIKKIAKDNTKRLFPMTVDSLSEILGFTDPPEGNLGLVVSNKKRIHGAIYMFDKDLLNKLAEKMNDDIVILPSSIHEVIMRPVKDSDILRVVNLVRMVNKEQVALEDRLSDNVYVYSKETMEISVVS